MSQKIYKNDNGTIIANRMDDVANVSFKEYMLKFHAMSIAPVISTLAFKFFKFLPIDSYIRIVSRQSFELAKTELEKLGKNNIARASQAIVRIRFKEKRTRKDMERGVFKHKSIGSYFCLCRKFRI